MTGAELSLLDFIQTHLRSDMLDTLMVWISALGNGGAVWLALGLALLLRRKTRRVGICLLLALALSAAACSLGLKPLIARPRPCDINPAVPLLIPNPADFSFPSGHTAASFAAASVLYFCRCHYAYLAAILAACIAFSRLYLYVHFPTDVLGGAVIGILLGWCSVQLVRLVFRKIRLQKEK